MSSKSEYKPVSEEEELERYMEEQRKARRELIKRVLVIILCVFLIIAFCFPAAGLLMG